MSVPTGLLRVGGRLGILYERLFLHCRASSHFRNSVRNNNCQLREAFPSAR